MKSRLLYFIALLSVLAFACSSQVFGVIPTNTPVPPTVTATPTLQPTPTPTPDPIKGVDVPLKFSGANFFVTGVYSSANWLIQGQEAYPQTLGDIFLIVEFDVTGNLDTVPLPQNDDPYTNYHIRDSNGSKDVWTNVDPYNGKVYFVFIVDGSADSYIFVFPNQAEIDLIHFEILPFPNESLPGA